MRFPRRRICLDAYRNRCPLRSADHKAGGICFAEAATWARRRACINYAPMQRVHVPTFACVLNLTIGGKVRVGKSPSL
jgi:hypothetical protein